MAELREQFAHALADRYVNEREIGAGGMATVFLARDLIHNRKVALKILDPERLTRESQLPVDEAVRITTAIDAGSPTRPMRML